MDADTLLKGDMYENLKESYVIFICMFDPFGKGKPKYTFRNICEDENEIIFNDKTHKMLYNVNGTDKKTSPELKAFLEYVKTKSATDSFTEKLDAIVEKIKHTNKYRREYLTYQVHINDWKEEGRLVGLQQGVLQGEHNARIETARGMLADCIPLPSIAKYTGLSIEQLQNITTKA